MARASRSKKLAAVLTPINTKVRLPSQFCKMGTSLFKALGMLAFLPMLLGSCAGQEAEEKQVMAEKMRTACGAGRMPAHVRVAPLTGYRLVCSYYDGITGEARYARQFGDRDASVLTLERLSKVTIAVGASKAERLAAVRKALGRFAALTRSTPGIMDIRWSEDLLPVPKMPKKTVGACSSFRADLGRKGRNDAIAHGITCSISNESALLRSGRVPVIDILVLHVLGRKSGMDDRAREAALAESKDVLGKFYVLP